MRGESIGFENQLCRFCPLWEVPDEEKGDAIQARDHQSDVGTELPTVDQLENLEYVTSRTRVCVVECLALNGNGYCER